MDALLRMPLKELLPQLDEQQFWQVHRAVIVRSDRIAAAVRSDEGQMHLKLRGHPDILPVSRQFQSLFRGQ
jgi:DNA-binding LytR/AlgR family response regulator